MLREIKTVKQEPGSGRRRWFESDALELVVWLGHDERVTGFQICYDFGRGDYALTWREPGGFVHSAIDMGDETPFVNRSPVLEPDASIPWCEVAQAFDRCSATLEPALRRLVKEKMEQRAAVRPSG